MVDVHGLYGLVFLPPQMLTAWYALTVQVPARRATERNKATIATWRTET